MKKTINKLSLRYALSMLVLLTMCVTSAWADTPSNRTSVDLPQTAGYTLEPGKMYIVRNTMTITATVGNGLNVKAKGSEQAPILYIPADVTLTVNGAPSNGQAGGGAGIYVPQDAELIITGAGTLVANGGAAGNGGAGQNGQNGGNRTKNTDGSAIESDCQFKDPTSENLLHFSGAGGNGGNGGGGAGAGIGGIGGVGGNGGLGGASKYFTVDGRSSTKSGEDGKKGGNGSKGASMGKVYIMGAVTVTATAGAVGTAGGAGGNQGYTLYENYSNNWDVAGGGGGGAGGGAGYTVAYGIGAGGRGAGGGAGGGSGSADYETNWNMYKPTQKNSLGHASSATGVGVGAVSGTAGNENVLGRDTGNSGTVLSVLYGEQGGNGSDEGGNAGGAASKTDNGYLYVGDNAIFNGHKGYDASKFGGTKETNAPADMTITLTFKNGESTVGTLPAVIGNSLPDAPVSPYQLTVAGEYFAGYYTATDGKGSRIYKGIGSTNLDKVANVVPFSQDATIYAHFSHNQHNISWDYTYRKIDETGYADVVEGDRVKRARLTFFFRNGDSESRILTAANVSGTGTEASHLLSTSAITLFGTTGSDILTGNTISIYLGDEKLSQFVNYTFEALNNSAETVPTNWSIATDKTSHNTIVSFTGATADKCFEQTWTVTLKNLKVYPEYIFVKPMYAEPDGYTYAVISQLANTAEKQYDGVQCAWTSRPAENASSCTYTGSYSVWKYKDGTTSYKNKIGLVGFVLNGEKYYMDQDPGIVHNDMVSLDEYNSATNISIYAAGETILDIKMDVDAYNIPALRFMENGGTLSSTTPYIYISETRSTESNLNTRFTAYRPGYTFKGWYDAETAGNVVNEWNGTSAKTVYAQWTDASAPVIVPVAEEHLTDHSVVLKVNVTDAESGLATEHAVQYSVQLTSNVNPESIGDWADMTNEGSDVYSCTIDNRSLVYVYVKATNKDDLTRYAISSQIQVDHQAPVITADPAASKVCEHIVSITITDNVAVISVKVNETDYSSSIVDGQFSTTLSTAGEYTIVAQDEAGNESTMTVTLYASHNWSAKQTAADPTDTKIGSKVDYHYCSNCGEYALDNDGSVGEIMTESEVAQNIIPAGSVLVKDGDGNTKAWADDLNTAIGLISDETGNNIKLTKDTEVENHAISTPTSPATIDLNGYGLTVDGEPYTTGGGITGNSDVTILLNDNGSIPYTNGSKVSGSPIRYERNLAVTARINKWQALYVPINAALQSGYDLGTASAVSTESENAYLKIEKIEGPIVANTPYFVRNSATGALTLTSSDNVLAPVAGYSQNIGDTGYNMTACYSDLSASSRQFWVLTNGGKFAKAATTAHQRPYHWVIYEPITPGSKPIASFFIIEDYAPTAAPVVKTTDVDADAPVRTIGGAIVNGKAPLAPGIYIRGGKKFVVK